MTRTGYGQYYWCVRVAEELSPSGEIYVNADSVIETPAGSLEFIRNDSDYRLNLSIAAGLWKAVFAASQVDGSATAVAYWTSEVQ